MIPRNYTSYVPRYVIILEQLVIPPLQTPQIAGNQFIAMVKPIISKDKRLLPQ